MQFTSYSLYPNKPCILLQWPETTVMLDCTVDMSPFFNFLPQVYQSPRLKGLPFSKKFGINYVKELQNNFYVDGVPEVQTVSLDALQMEQVDCILVSNWDSLIALPFYTEGTGFQGAVYATDPVLQFGRLLIDELLEYFGRIDVPPADDRWKSEDVCTSFTNAPLRNPKDWCQFYTAKEAESSMSKVTTVCFNQEVKVLQLSITALRSGYTIGSANWKIKSDDEQFGYLSATSLHMSHTATADISGLRDCDKLIVTSLSRYPDNPPEHALPTILQVITETLKMGGNVLLPMNSAGCIFDMISQVSKIIDNTNGISLDTPIYFVSPIAKSSLAFSNVNAEWLNEQRQALVYTPEEPFSHSQLIKANRLRVFESLFGSFSKEYRSPCVMFASHTSLRIGDAAHMLELWGSDKRNTVIITDNDVTFEEAYAPYKNLPIRCVHCPIETRIDYKALNLSLLPELRPKMLYVPYSYTVPLFPGRHDLMVQYGVTGQITPIGYDEPILLPMKKTKKRKITVHPDLIDRFQFKAYPGSEEQGICTVAAHLTLFNDEYQLVPPPPKKKWCSRPKYIGTLTPEALMRCLKEKSLKCFSSRTEKGTVVRIDSLHASITVDKDGKKTNIQAPKEHRPRLLEIVTSLLKPVGSK